MGSHWDIFCRVVDNYGDIGVCWRLARQLAGEHGLAVRLWVDDPAALARLCPEIDPGSPEQSLEGVRVLHWTEPWLGTGAADVVVEAFACDLPAAYLQAMAARVPKPRWVNLEYLSAEDWIEGCHRLASPHPTLPLVKHFFFPGFTAATGGLLREADLFARRDRQPPPPLAGRPLEVSLFCYDDAPVGELIECWARGAVPVRCRVAPGKPLAAVQRYLGSALPARRGKLEIIAVPFAPQAGYDAGLWACDINFVRGEDSFVRAQWAARPFVWQIYPQPDSAHLTKLDAFLGRYCATLPAAAAEAVRGLFHAWNEGGGLAAAWPRYLEHHAALAAHARPWAESLASLGDLAGNLVKFYSSNI